MTKLQWKHVLPVFFLALLVAIGSACFSAFADSEPVESDRVGLGAPQPQVDDNPIKTKIIAELSDDYSPSLTFMLESADYLWSDSEISSKNKDSNNIVVDMSVPLEGEYLLTVVGYWDTLDGRLVTPVVEYPINVTNNSVNNIVLNVNLTPADNDRAEAMLIFAGLNGKSRARVDNLPDFVKSELDKFDDRSVCADLYEQLKSMNLQHCYPNKGGEA